MKREFINASTCNSIPTLAASQVVQAPYERVKVRKVSTNAKTESYGRTSNRRHILAAVTMILCGLNLGCSPSKSSTTDSRMMAAAAEAEAAEAEMAALQLKGTGLSSGSKKSATSKSASRHKVVKQRAPAAAKTARGEVAYIVQVGSFKVKENADQVMAKIKAEGLPVSMRTSTTASGAALYVVRFEPTPSMSEAESFKSKAKDLVGAEAAILNR